MTLRRSIHQIDALDLGSGSITSLVELCVAHSNNTMLSFTTMIAHCVPLICIKFCTLYFDGRALVLDLNFPQNEPPQALGFSS